jgi:hypothetical protein
MAKPFFKVDDIVFEKKDDADTEKRYVELF